jgi:hypothetical protein
VLVEAEVRAVQEQILDAEPGEVLHTERGKLADSTGRRNTS